MEEKIIENRNAGLGETFEACVINQESDADLIAIEPEAYGDDTMVEILVGEDEIAEVRQDVCVVEANG